MNSQSIKDYPEFIQSATEEQIRLVDEIFKLCEDHYDNGGDTVVECYSPENILQQFESIDDVKIFCNLKIEQATNARWGEDDDPELKKKPIV